MSEESEGKEEFEEKPKEVEKEEYYGLPEDAKVVEERVYVIPLWKVRSTGRGLYRTKKAIHFLRSFIIRHMKNPNVKISSEVNEELWSRGIRNPPRRIKVRVVRTAEDEIWVLPYRE